MILASEMPISVWRLRNIMENRENIFLDKEISRTVSVIVERRPAVSRWADWIWSPCEIIEGRAAAAPFVKLGETPDGVARYFAGSIDIVLHRKETEAYLINLAGDRVLYAVLRSDGDGELPYTLHAVTASPYEAQDHLDSGDEIVEAIAMPPSIAELVEAFCAFHHKEEPFIKRKRDRLKVEELKFGKEPIFERPGRAGSGEDGNDT